MVLKKLHSISIQGLSVMEEGGRYLYDWDTEKTVAQNKQLVAKEDATLAYLIDIGVVNGERMPNEYRRQHKRGQELSPPIKVWADWDVVDEAYREYEWETYVYSIDTDKLRAELKHFGFEAKGLKIVAVHSVAETAAIIAAFGPFAALEDGTTCYERTPIKLKPQASRLIHALLLKRGATLSFEEAVNTVWDEDHDSQGFLDNPKHTTGAIKKQISNIVSEANASLFVYDNKKHIVSAGQTSYKFVI